jgi:hypothetical protein
MTVPSTAISDTYVSDGTATPRSIGFALLDASHLVLTVDGVAKTLNAHYTITGNLRIKTQSEVLSGVITPTPAFANGAVIAYRRVTPNIQQYNSDPGVPLSADQLELELDRRAMIEQEQAAGLGDLAARAIKVSEEEVAPDVDLTGLIEGDLIQYRGGKLRRFLRETFAGKLWGGDASGAPVPVTGNGGADAALRGDLALGTGASLSGFLSTGVGAVTRTLFAWLMDRPINPKNFGVTFHATAVAMVDSGAAWTKVFNAAALLGLNIECPNGYCLIADTSIALGGVGYIPPAGCHISGQGRSTVIRFKNLNFSGFYGFNVRASDVHISNMVLETDKGGFTWCSAIAWTRPAGNATIFRPRLTNVHFRGIGVRAGHWGVIALNANVTDIAYRGCSAEKMEFGGFTKNTADVSTQRDWLIDQFHAEDCTEAFEFNSPGLFRGVTVVGSAVVTAITDDDGAAFDTSLLVINQEIRSTAFPKNTKVVAINSGTQITLSNNALVAQSAIDKARLSGGGCDVGKIINFTASFCGQWPLGFSNCRQWVVEAYGADLDYELVHLEDSCTDFEIVFGGERCNLLPGVVGSAGADNGMVALLPGCQRIHLRARDVDLRGSTGTPVALCVFPSGLTGTLGQSGPSTDIFLSGSVLAKLGCRAVTAYNTHIDFQDFRASNPDPASKAAIMFYMPGCSWSGGLSVVNPKTIFACDINSTMNGVLDRLTIFTSEKSLPDLVFASGFFPVERNSMPIARAINLHMGVTVDPAATWRTICPAPYSFIGRAIRQYHGGGGNHAYEVAPDFRIVNGALAATDVFPVSGGALDINPGSGVPIQTDDGWRISGGLLQSRVFAPVAAETSLVICFEGAFFVKAS